MLVQAGSLPGGDKFLFAGLWEGVAEASTFQKIKAHLSRQQAEVQGGSMEDWAGNAAVDLVAQQAAEEGWSPWKHKLAEATQYLEAWVKQMASLELWPRDREWFKKGQKRRPRFQSRSTCWPGAFLSTKGNAPFAAGGHQPKAG